MNAQEVLIETKALTKCYKQSNFWRKDNSAGLVAVDHVDLTIFRGETLGIVGESGCGKSTLGRMLVRLLEPTEGQIFFRGQDITACSEKELRPLKRQMQIVFQDPYSALNPWMTIQELVTEPVLIHKIVPPDQTETYVRQLLAKVGLAACDCQRYPHQFSGGQRQRVCIARALAVEPAFILCDEPVSALDVSIQSQIINLLMDLQEELGLTYMFISHSFPVIRNMADRVAVMYMGRIVEMAPAETFFAQPRHPYSHMLLDAVLSPDPQIKRRRTTDFGEISRVQEPGCGCAFYARCPRRQSICRERVPELKEVDKQHIVACYCDEKSILEG